MLAYNPVAETWGEFSAGSCIIILRLFTRLKMVGIQGLKPDDYLIVFAWLCYSAMTGMAHIVGYAQDNGNIPTEMRASMSEEEKALRSLGAKCFMVGWFTYIGLIWTLKMNMLFFYKRVVNGLWVEKFILPAQIIVGITATLAILAKLRVSIWRRIGIFILFGAGIFIMVAACLRVYFVIATKTGASAAIWSCREDLVAVFVGNAPLIRPLFSRKLWRGGYHEGARPGYKNTSDSIELSGKFPSTSGKRNSRSFYGRNETTVTNTDSDSMERIVGNIKDNDLPTMVINVRKDVDIDEDVEDHASVEKSRWQRGYRDNFRNA
ncbi:hypothetical protein FQN53_007643 [Emmonsiellopsis sp. PD_33]|nr:hypothetical protein FQN53_007643 [Emmonsiellopsis sp. PD_33]